MTFGRITGALPTSVHATFAGSKLERPRKKGGDAWESSPPKAEARGSNPFGCATYSAATAISASSGCSWRCSISFGTTCQNRSR